MAVKRWQGNTSAAWDTAANWIGGVKPAGQGSTVAIDEAASGYGSANRRLSLTTAAHTLAAGDSIRIAGITLARWIILNWSASTPYNLTVETAVDNTQITILIPSGGIYDPIHTWLTNFPTGMADSGTVQFMGDDVQMLSGDKGTNYCTTGPASTITINSLTVTLPANIATAPQILSSSATTISIASTFSFTEAAGTVTGGWVFGTSLTVPILLSGCVGTVIGQPPSSGIRTVTCSMNAGSTCTVSALALASVSDTGQFIFGTGNNACAGTITIASDSPSPAVNVAHYLQAGGVLNVNRTLQNGLAVYTNSTSTTININAQTFWPLYLIAGGTINANAPLVITQAASTTCITQNTTINANAPVTLANFGVTSGKTLTVNVSGPNAVTQVDVTGTVVVNNRFVTPAGVGPSSLLTVGA